MTGQGSDAVGAGAAGTGQDEALASFLAKWATRWPEWNVAEVFLPREQREPARAWASLLQELTLAAWGGAEARPGELKLAWWQDELAGWSRGARRHPLGIVLQRRPAPWAELGTALPTLQAARDRPGDADEAFACLEPFSRSVVGVEGALFAEGAARHARQTDASASGAVAASEHAPVSAALLYSRFGEDGDRFVPLAIVARAARGSGDPRALWADELASRWPPAANSIPRVRRLWTALAQRRLAHRDVTRPLPAWSALNAAWRAARN